MGRKMLISKARAPAWSRLRRVGFAVGLAAILLSVATTVAAAPRGEPILTTLQPGGFRIIEHPLDVNVVFVGLDSGPGIRQIDLPRFLAALPRESRPRVRTPYYAYGIVRDLGLHFTYRYHVSFASQAFDDAFFAYLATHGTAGPPTLYQRLYNEQRAATRHIDSNLMIDGVDTERWLGEHAASIGVDTKKETIFFINWYGRADFRDHLYYKPGEPDPDTGISDALRDYGPGDAWGGTTPADPERPLGSLRRIWFYDASAAVDYIDGSWNVDDACPYGEAGLCYRMPPIWEYGNPNGYRPFIDVTGDLAKLARYVAIDELFTPSPLYDPAISGPKLPSRIEIDLTGLNGRPGEQAVDLVRGSLVTAKISSLEPYNQFSYEAQGHDLAGRELDVYTCFLSFFGSDPHSCYGNRLYPLGFGDLFLWVGDHLFSEFIEGTPDYEIPVAFYDLPDALASGFTGYTDDNWKDGIQSYIYTFHSPALAALTGLGPTDSVIHEVGHYLGLSHPHDGFDWETGVDFAPQGDFYFAWEGDYSDTVMSYFAQQTDFSQFDRDALDRDMTSIYINEANAILGNIYASGKANDAANLLVDADRQAAAALTELAAMDYRAAPATAKASYDDVLAAAAEIGVKVEPESVQADYNAQGHSFMLNDPLRDPRADVAARRR